MGVYHKPECCTQVWELSLRYGQREDTNPLWLSTIHLLNHLILLPNLVCRPVLPGLFVMACLNTPAWTAPLNSWSHCILLLILRTVHCAASFWMVPFVTFDFVQCLRTCMVRIVFLIIWVTLDYLIDSKHTEFNYI